MDGITARTQQTGALLKAIGAISKARRGTTLGVDTHPRSNEGTDHRVNRVPHALIAGLAASVLGLLGAVVLVDTAITGTSGTGDVVFLGVLVAIFLGGGVWLTARDLKLHGLRPEFKAAVVGTIAGLTGMGVAIAASISLGLSITRRGEGLLVFLLFFALPCVLAYRWVLRRTSSVETRRR